MSDPLADPGLSEEHQLHGIKNAFGRNITSQPVDHVTCSVTESGRLDVTPYIHERHHGQHVYPGKSSFAICTCYWHSTCSVDETASNQPVRRPCPEIATGYADNHPYTRMWVVCPSPFVCSGQTVIEPLKPHEPRSAYRKGLSLPVDTRAAR